MKIANAGAFWGDDNEAAFRIASEFPDLDYLTLDYLAELSMAILAIQKEKKPDLGYASDFIEVVKSLIPLWNNGAHFKIVTNAGGLNPEGLAQELQKIVPHKKIISVGGDGVLANLKSNPSNPLYNHLETGAPLSGIPLVSANAYLGASGIVKALKAGADIVVTGRIADPSMVVGPAIASFNWSFSEYDKLAQATVAGHLIECGTQATGGISSEWDTIQDPAHIGFPVIEMEPSGEFVLTKSPDAAGVVNIATTKEQLLYEIGDPSRYLSPDVNVSFLSIKLEEIAPNRIKVTGSKGSPPTDYYKVSAAYRAGFRVEGSLVFMGENSLKHAKKSAEILRLRAPVEFFHSETYGESGKTLLRIAARDLNKEKVEKLSRLIAPLVTSGPPGTTGYTGGRPKVRPVFGYWPCLILKEALHD